MAPLGRFGFPCYFCRHVRALEIPDAHGCRRQTLALDGASICGTRLRQASGSQPLQWRAEVALLAAGVQRPGAAGQRDGAVVARNDAPTAARGGDSRASPRGHRCHRRPDHPYLYGHGRHAWRLPRNDPGFRECPMGGVAPSKVVSRKPAAVTVFERRERRARFLAGSYTASAEILTFYAGIASWQHGASAESKGFGGIPGVIPSLCLLVERTGPAPLAEAARKLDPFRLDA